MRTVCLLTAGTGSRMGKYSTVINKALLPIKGKAIISHIIEQFPDDTQFVVAVGYRKDDVMDYLRAAYPDRNFIFNIVENYEGIGSGPAHSVYCCRKSLEFAKDGFTLIACDGLYSDLINLPTDRNVIGISKVSYEDSINYCNVQVNPYIQNLVTAVSDKEYCDYGTAANGVYHFKDATAFFTSLSGSEISSGYKWLQMHGHELEWTDLGTEDRYIQYYQSTYASDSYDYSKSNEFLYFVNGRVIKFFSDVTIAKNRIEKSQDRKYFPKITYYNNNTYAYMFVPGSTLYERNDLNIFQKFITFLHKTVWPDLKTETKLTTEDLTKFYKDKTYQRLEMFEKKYPDFHPKHINGKHMHKTMRQCLERIDWDYLLDVDLENRTAFIHGDLQFDNIIYTGSRFVFLDWRQDFAGHIQIGDMYYDLAKLVGGMHINYDLIKKNMFTFKDHHDKITYEYSSRPEYDKMIQHLHMLNLYDMDLIELIVSLIYLNMSPLHEAPYDKMLYSIALERLNAY